MIWKQKDIQELLASNDKAVERAIVTIYKRQTADEKEMGATSHSNGVGFSGSDAEFGSSLAKQVLAGRRLTPNQIVKGRAMIKKYWKQLSEEAEKTELKRKAEGKAPVLKVQLPLFDGVAK